MPIKYIYFFVIFNTISILLFDVFPFKIGFLYFSDYLEMNNTEILFFTMSTGTVNPKMEICWDFTHIQAIQYVDVSSSEQI